MADDIGVTPGAGKTVSADEVTTLNGVGVGAKIIQRVLLAVRTAAATAVDLATGAGAANTGTLRTIHASDDPLLTAVLDTTPTPVRLAGDKVIDGTTLLTPKFAAISAAGAGDNTVIAAVATKKIRVLGFHFTGAGAVNAKWRTNATDISGLTYIGAAGGGISVAFNPLGWFETAAGDPLKINLSAAVAIGGSLVYVEV